MKLTCFSQKNARLQGCDFHRNHSIPHIDFCTIHLWPDSWLKSDEDHKLNFVSRWISCHVECCDDLGKPLVITEFGKKPAGPVRAAFYEKVGHLSVLFRWQRLELL